MRSQAQTGKPDITEWRSGAGRSLRRPRWLLARRAPFVAGVARTGGGAEAAQRVSVLGARTGAGTPLAWEQGAPCRVAVPEGTLRMKLLWRAKMVTEPCLSRLLWALGTPSE